jgi:hypothetical protein
MAGRSLLIGVAVLSSEPAGGTAPSRRGNFTAWHGGDDDQMSQCALWYVRHHAPRFELCGSEEDAVQRGMWVEEHGDGSVLGVQFADRNAVPREEWRAWQEGQRQREQEYQARLEAQVREPRATKEICDPFSGQPLMTDAFTPRWVGKQPD